MLVGDFGDKPCTFTGYPSVGFLDGAGPLPFTYQDGGGPYLDPAAAATVTLTPQVGAQLEIAKYRCDAGDLRPATRFELAMPGDVSRVTFTVPAWAAISYCKGGSSDPGQIVHVSHVERVTYRPPYDERFNWPFAP